MYMLTINIRAEGAHAYLKRHLGGKRTKGDLFSTWKNIEAAVINQIATIQGLASSERERTPLDVDRKLFRGVFGIVTWHALRLVQRHCNQVTLPLKPCTGAFTRSLGLPCAHLCDERRVTTGLTPLDFHPHWYWNREDTQLPYLEPLQVKNKGSQALTAQNTDRILSRFETSTLRRAEPICSACHRKGHIMTSRNCPEKLYAAIAESNRLLREQELSQSSDLLLSTPSPLRRIATIVNVTTAVATDSISVTTTLAGPISSLTVFTDAHSSMAPANPSITLHANPQSTFRMPPPCPSSPEDNLGTPRLPFDYDTYIAPPSPKRSPPLKPLGPERPEMVFLRYKAEKEAWLANNPSVRPSEYRKKRGWKTLRPIQLKEHLRHMPPERRELSGKLIQAKANWSTEEIMAWLDNEERLENELFESMLLEQEKANHFIQHGITKGTILQDVLQEAQHFTL